MSEITRLFHMMENVPTWQLLIALAISFAAFILTFLIGMKMHRSKIMLNICSVMLILCGLAMTLFWIWGLVSLCGWTAVMIGMGILFVGAALWPYIDDFVKAKKQQKVVG